MSDEKVLTKEIAEQFLADEDSVDLSEFTAIEDDAAKRLGDFDGGDIWLPNLNSLTDGAAEGLSKCHGDLYLESLKTLSDSQAESLRW